MNFSKEMSGRLLLLIGIILLGTFASAIAQNAPPSVTLSGAVTDSAGKPIQSVMIKVYRDGKLLGPAERTDSKGVYSVDIPDGTPIDAISYEHSEWQPGLVRGLSGKATNQINKVLYAPDRELSFEVAVEQLSTYQQLYFIHAVAAEDADWLEQRNSYGKHVALLGKINSQNVPEFVLSKYFAAVENVASLYNF
jgi:hypothetical protein